MMQTETILEIVGKIADRISEEKLFLTELDNATEDGDHGINMSRGFEAVKEKLTGADIAAPADPGNHRVRMISQSPESLILSHFSGMLFAFDDILTIVCNSHVV